MSSFNWRKSFKGSIKDELIMSLSTTGIFFALKIANVNRAKASLGIIDIMNLAGCKCVEVLVNDYTVCNT